MDWLGSGGREVERDDETSPDLETETKKNQSGCENMIVFRPGSRIAAGTDRGP